MNENVLRRLVCVLKSLRVTKDTGSSIVEIIFTGLFSVSNGDDFVRAAYFCLGDCIEHGGIVLRNAHARWELETSRSAFLDPRGNVVSDRLDAVFAHVAAAPSFSTMARESGCCCRAKASYK
jgi:hypothetical protein